MGIYDLELPDIGVHLLNSERKFHQKLDSLEIEHVYRKYNDGPLSMATDMMVWNLNRDGVTERMAVSPDEAWDVPGTEKCLEPDKSRKDEIIWPELVKQRLDMTDVNKAWIDEYKKRFGLK